MSSKPVLYGEIEAGLYRVQVDAYELELRVADPTSAGEIAPLRGPTSISLSDLQALLLSPLDYGQKLTDQVFADPELRGFYAANKATFDSRGMMIRLRLLIGPDAPELFGVRWELLLDPNTREPLATSERTVFSRFMLVRSWRAIQLRARAELQAIIAVSAPTDLSDYGLAAIDKAGEIARAGEALKGVSVTVVGETLPLTLGSLIGAVKQGADIVYLVCHGGMPQGRNPCLYLQDEDGKTAAVKATDLAQRIGELQEVPRLIVMASCESAGRELDKLTNETSAAQTALAPHLAEAGVPAVVAMQGRISMETIKQAMPVFFSELMKDGQIDRAMAAARGTVRDRFDSWMPALFLRLKGGCIWYEPGFGDIDNDLGNWESICRSVHAGEFIPILGPELGEHIFGGTAELATRLAERHRFTLAENERADLAKVMQYIATNNPRRSASQMLEEEFWSEIAGRLDGQAKGKPASELLKIAVQQCLSDPEDPYNILAQLHAPIYLNASCEELLFQVLVAAGRQAEKVYAAWRGSNPQKPQPKVVVPTPEHPWIYHLFGVFGEPDTMVLTEDDFFDYLIKTSKLDLLLKPLVSGLMGSSLLFLGFRLDDWRFRVLFRMIVTSEGAATMRDFSHVGVQVNPDEQTLADAKRARKYLQDYFEKSKNAPTEISIYWGSPADFLKQLGKHLAELPHAQAVGGVGGS